jgi:tRNA(Ile)-lysidine synthase
MLGEALDAVELTPPRRLVVAFSGGPDSTALLATAKRLAGARALDLCAVHVDHALDPDSPRRARAARALAERLDVDFLARAAEIDRSGARSLEAAARAARYWILERERLRLGASWILTAHHREDQLETLLLRLRQGSGVRGLAGIRRRRHPLLRPLLDASRGLLSRSLADRADLDAVSDPTNRSLRHARNRVRLRLLPALLDAEPADAGDALASLAARVASRAASARARTDDRLAARVDLRRLAGEAGPSLSTSRLLELPESLLRHWSVALLAERCGEPYPPGGRVVDELLRQMLAGRRARCDWGRGRFLEARDGRLRLGTQPARVPLFSYTFRIPGAVRVPELSVTLRLDRAEVSPWMFRCQRDMTGLRMAVPDGHRLTVRSRRPEDRIVPFGERGARLLDHLLSDRSISRAERDRLPLLCDAERVLWAPGVTLAESCRIQPQWAGNRSVWRAELVR